MLKESEIRQYRDAIAKVLKESPCKCPSCASHRVIATNLIETLSWVLGERPGLSNFVDNAVKLAADIDRAKGAIQWTDDIAVSQSACGRYSVRQQDGRWYAGFFEHKADHFPLLESPPFRTREHARAWCYCHAADLPLPAGA